MKKNVKEELRILTNKKGELDIEIENIYKDIEKLNKEKEDLKKNNDYTENLKYIEKVILDRFNKDYSDTQLNDFICEKLKYNITTIPVKLDYLRLISEKSMIVLSSQTNIEIKDRKGKNASIRKDLLFFPIDSGQRKLYADFRFDIGTNIERLVFDGDTKYPDEIKKMLKTEDNGLIFLPITIQKEDGLERFKSYPTVLHIDLDNCFTKDTEYWNFHNDNHPVLYEKVSISMAKKPTNHKSYIWCRKKNMWELLPKDNPYVHFTNSCENKLRNLYSLEYFIDYQGNHKTGDKSYSRKFRIEWSTN